MKIIGWLSASLADYDGHYQGAVANPVYLERDQLGYLTVQAQDRSDAVPRIEATAKTTFLPAPKKYQQQLLPAP